MKQKHSLPIRNVCILLAVMVITAPNFLFANDRPRDRVPDRVQEIFENKCAFAGCHSGTSPGGGLDLTEEYSFTAMVNQPSNDFPQMKLVKPGEPIKSYLMAKLVGTSGIRGARMPKSDSPLAKAELRAIATWIKSIPRNSRPVEPKKRFKDSFPGLSVASFQTAQTAARGSFSYRIAHRWLGRTDTGFSQFFGLDVGAHMLTEFSFAILPNFTTTLGRSGQQATFEFNNKWQLWRERTNGSQFLSAAVFAGFDWITAGGITDPSDTTQTQILSLTDGERFAWYGQLILEKQISSRLAVLVSPGILLNGNIAQANENPVFSLGYAAKLLLWKGFSVFVEGAPILSGINGALPAGGARMINGRSTVFDSFTAGFEQNLGGHVFHLYITNSIGLTPSQIMSGGNLDFTNGEFRLGFNIYRAFNYPGR